MRTHYDDPNRIPRPTLSLRPFFNTIENKIVCRQALMPTFRTLTVHYLRLATGRVSEGELLARSVDGGLYREQLKYLRLNRC
jgi:hypothetical protein